ncbi:transferase [Schizophyllum commune]
MEDNNSSHVPLVQITSKRPLFCGHEEAVKKFPPIFRLGPFDQLTVHYLPVAVIFVYNAAHAVNKEPISVERLEKALGRLLDYYPHLTGRRRINPVDGTAEIDRLGSGAALYTAECGSRLDVCHTTTPDGQTHLAMSDLPGSGEQLVAPSVSTLEGAAAEPILTVQHTRFACGSVSLGVCLQHIVCDLDGFMQLTRDLAEIYRGIAAAEAAGGTHLDVVLEAAPCLQSYIPENVGKQLTADEQVENYTKDHSPVSSANVSVSARPDPPPPVIGKILRFSGAELKAIKDAATDASGDGWVSTFEALSAHLWQCVHRARTQLNPERAEGAGDTLATCSDFLAPVNCRSRLRLPPRYFPNAVICPYARLPFATLQNAPLFKIAQTLHDALQAVTREHVEGTLRYIAAKAGVVEQRFRHGPDSFIVTSWNKVDMYGVYFDAEKRVAPVLVSAPFTPISLVNGLAYFLPTGPQKDSDGAIDASLTLYAPVWEALEGDPDFRKFKR